MSDTIDSIGGFRGAAQAPDRRPSLNTQAAIDTYDYRFACWEVVDGADLKAVCHRLDVPGGPSVLGPKVVALRARLEACAKVGRPPPERPTAPPARVVAHMTADEAIAVALGPTDKARLGLAVDATALASAAQMKGRALVTCTVEPTDEAAPAVPAVPVDAPWRHALTIKVSAAAVQAVAEQEGADPVKALRAAGFAERAEALRAEIAASMLAAATAPALPAPPPFELTPEQRRELAQLKQQTDAHLEMESNGRLLGESRWLGVAKSPLAAEAFTVITDTDDGMPAPVERVERRRPLHVRSYTAIAGNGEDIPTPTEIAAADAEAEAEALWEQRHNEETVLAAQAEHARQRELLQQLGQEEREDEPTAATARPAPKVPVARGRSLKTLAASAETPVVKAPLRGRTAPPPVAPPAASAAPAKPLPLPKWPAKAPVVVSDPPPKRDRSKNRQVAPKPPEPAQAVLLGMSPETTTPTSVRRPHRRKVPAPAPVAEAPKVQAPRAPKSAAAAKPRPAPIELALPEEVIRNTSPEVQRLLLDAVRVCRKFRTGRMPPVAVAVADAAPFVPIDLAARAAELHQNAQTIMRCARPAHAKLSDRRWHEQLKLLVQGTISAAQLAALAKIPTSTVMNHIRRTGGSIRLLPYIGQWEGKRVNRALPVHPINAKTARGMKRLRAMYALTPEEFARCLGVTTSTVPRFEGGVELPRPEVIRAAMAVFNAPWREVLQIDDDAWLLRELTAMSHQGRVGMLYRHMLAKFVLPEFGLSGMLDPQPTTEQKPPVADTKAAAGRIEARPSNISEWSRVRYAVLIGDREIAYADTLKAETPERVRQLLQNQLLINARQGGDGLPRGWLSLLPADLGPGVSGRLKEELMELRDQIDNIGQALGLPARCWSSPDQECDADLTDAERAALKAPTRITDRAQLLKDPTEGDSCAEYTIEPATRDCATDGHYLCEGCGRLDRKKRARSSDHFSPTDEPDDSQE